MRGEVGVHLGYGADIGEGKVPDGADLLVKEGQGTLSIMRGGLERDRV